MTIELLARVRRASAAVRSAHEQVDEPDAEQLDLEQASAAAALRNGLRLSRPRLVLADVFDTILVRSTHPEDVKRLAARHLVARLDLTITPAELYLLRNRLERELCLRSAAAGLDEEFRLMDLAAELHEALAVSAMGLPQWREHVLAAELEVERDVQSLDHHVVRVLDEHTAAGGRLVLVSDFYLSAQALGELLAYAGFGPDRYERLIVSSDSLLTKRSGRLYDQVLADVDETPEHVLMVGDNAHSDGAMARRAGMAAVVLQRDAQRARYAHLARRASSPRAVAEALDAVVRTDPLPGTGPDVFPELALTMAFATWRLHQQLARRQPAEVLFLAREGLLLRTLFDTAERLTGVVSPGGRTRYVYVSRRSTFLPSLRPLEGEQFTSLFRQYRAISIREFLLNLGLSSSESDAVAAAADLAPDVVEADLPTSPAFSQLLASPVFRRVYEDRRSEQKALLSEYLAPGDDREDVELCVVDVGWKGTIQDHLHDALCSRAGVSGYYLGLVAAGREAPTNRKEGVLFDFRDAEGRFYDVFDHNRALYEVALSAPHGSTAGYARDADGRVDPVLEPVSDSDAAVAALVAPVQARLLVRAEQALAILVRSCVEEEAVLRHVARRHARMVYFPRRDELGWFGDVSHDENFGLFRRSQFAAGRVLQPRDRLTNAVALARAPRRVLAGSFWPRQGLEEMGLAPLGLLYGAYKARRVMMPRGSVR